MDSRRFRPSVILALMLTGSVPTACGDADPSMPRRDGATAGAGGGAGGHAGDGAGGELPACTEDQTFATTRGYFEASVDRSDRTGQDAVATQANTETGAEFHPAAWQALPPYDACSACPYAGAPGLTLPGTWVYPGGQVAGALDLIGVQYGDVATFPEPPKSVMYRSRTGTALDGEGEEGFTSLATFHTPDGVLVGFSAQLAQSFEGDEAIWPSPLLPNVTVELAAALCIAMPSTSAWRVAPLSVTIDGKSAIVEPNTTVDVGDFVVAVGHVAEPLSGEEVSGDVRGWQFTMFAVRRSLVGR